MQASLHAAAMPQVLDVRLRVAPAAWQWPGATDRRAARTALGGILILKLTARGRRARARLSNEHFAAFLQAIKELNSGRQTREGTLAAAADIFGPANPDLYASFDGLLSRHLPAQ